MKVKLPDKFLINMVTQGQKITQAIDGNTGWILIPGMGEPQELTEDVLAQLKQLPNSIIQNDFYNYKEKGSTSDFIGKENLNSKEFFRIRLITSDGSTKDYFIDSKSNICNFSTIKKL